jgi:hypothetical protein
MGYAIVETKWKKEIWLKFLDVAYILGG